MYASIDNKSSLVNDETLAPVGIYFKSSTSFANCSKI